MTSPDRTFWRHWTLACVAGEMVGIGVAAAAAVVLLSTVGQPTTPGERWGAYALLVGAGGIEGAALGGFQWRILRRRLPAMSARSWVGATVAVAVAGWALGMLPSTLAAPTTAAEPFDPSLALTAALAAVTGVGAGLAFGAAQWVVLRRFVENATVWIWANAIGWALGLAWIYLAAALPSTAPPLAVGVAVGLLAGLLSGLSVGAVTGRALVHLVSESPPAPASPPAPRRA